MNKKISSALISVFHKDHLEPIVRTLHSQGVVLYSTGGTQSFIEKLGIPVVPVENITTYPSIFDGRVKTLHPAVFGGILYRRDHAEDVAQAAKYQIPSIDLVIVDLYPFEKTVQSGASEEDIIEKIDIGGISLIRATAKNFNDTLIISEMAQYTELQELLQTQGGYTTLAQRKQYAARAFDISSHYDAAIYSYFSQRESTPSLKISERHAKELRYGENPHQKGVFYGHLEALFDTLNGKELSYNNLVDVDACVALIDEFEDSLQGQGRPTFAIIKHTNACGVATAESAHAAYLAALSCDPVSAFGGVIITNTSIDLAVAEELHKLFFEVLIAPAYEVDALELLKSKKNRILLKRKEANFSPVQVKTLLNGYILQDKDAKTETLDDLKVATQAAPTESEKRALIFANKIVKHTKSNTIVLAKEDRLLASGVGQTSRVDALRQAIEKAHSFGFDLRGSVMASDAFFPFPDCVEIGYKAGVTAVLQPGGSIKDQESIDYCNKVGISMVMTGTRHFLH